MEKCINVIVGQQLYIDGDLYKAVIPRTHGKCNGCHCLWTTDCPASVEFKNSVILERIERWEKR